MTTTDTIDALCAAIDAGDNEALGPLADFLEDVGDPRAAGIRWAVATRRRPEFGWPTPEGGTAFWNCLLPGGSDRPDTLPESLRRVHRGVRSAAYATRSAAYLDLAAALTEDDECTSEFWSAERPQ